MALGLQLGQVVAAAGVEGSAVAQNGAQLVQVDLDRALGALGAEGLDVPSQALQSVQDVVQSTAVCLEGWTCGDSVCHVPGLGPNCPGLRVECCRDTSVLWGRKRREKLLNC